MRESLLILLLVLLSAQAMASPYGTGPYSTAMYGIDVNPSTGGGGGSRQINPSCTDCAPAAIPDAPAEVILPATEQPAQIALEPSVGRPETKRSRIPKAAIPPSIEAPSMLTGFAIQASAITYPLRHPTPRDNPEIFYPVLLGLLCLLIWMEHKRTYPVLPYVFLQMPFTHRLGRWFIKPPKTI